MSSVATTDKMTAIPWVENAGIWRPNPNFKVKKMADYNVGMRDLLQAELPERL